MKKFKYLSLLLCMTLLMQCILMPVSAADISSQTAEETTVLTQPAEPEFGQVCIQRGCRTIEGMVPLGGSDYLLDTAQSAFLYEINTDTVVYAFNPDMKVHPGTLAKIMLAMIVLEECDMEETVVVTEGIQSYLPVSATRIDLKSLEELSVGDLLHATVLNNANDAAVALAHHVAGTTDAFLTMMNNRARQLGCTNTEFGNISGLFTAVSYSTARDMAKIVRAAIKNEDFVSIFGATEYTIAPTELYPEEREFYTGNYMMDQHNIPDFLDSRVTGGMQAYHEETGASVVCTADYNGLNYIAVVLGATRTFNTEPGWEWQALIYGNFNELTELLSYGYDNFKVNRIVYDGMSLSPFTVAGGESNAVGEARVDIDSVVPKSAQMDNLIMQFDTGGGLTAPVKAGEMIATMQISYRNSVMAEAEVYAISNVKSATDTGVVIRSTAVRSDSDTSGFLSVLGTICVFILILVAAYLAFNAYMRSRIRARRRRRRQNRRRNY